MPMRDSFHDDLDGIGVSLVEMGHQVNKAMERATTALLTADLKAAEEIISEDDAIDEMQHDIEARAINLMARQQPVAGDLRTLVTSLRMSADLERMGDLAHHVAKLTRMRYPSAAVPPELALTLQEMGNVTARITKKAIGVIESRDLEAALQLEKDDDEMDILHRRLFEILLDDSWPYGIETAIDMTLLGRYYERCSDHAVSIARRVYYLVTGEYANSANN
jgi:phosphate transport system protein